jgi:hypothetical protein
MTASPLVRRVIRPVKNSGSCARYNESPDLDFIRQKNWWPAKVENPLRYAGLHCKQAILSFEDPFHRGYHFLDFHRLHAAKVERTFT